MTEAGVAEPDPWDGLRSLTPARLALGRAGASLPTAARLGLQLDHARARDAVDAPFDADAALAALEPIVGPGIVVDSEVGDRSEYRRRPDRGRHLRSGAADRVTSLGRTEHSEGSVALVLADGLSPAAVVDHGPPVVDALARALERSAGPALGPVVVVRGGRVAVGDEVGALLGARLVVVLIGERPGLSAPTSLGAYVTFAPQVGRTDAERSCVSNIRPGGLTPELAGQELAALVVAALDAGTTGVALDRTGGEARAGLER